MIRKLGFGMFALAVTTSQLAVRGAEDVAFAVQTSREEFQVGEPIVVTVSMSNRGAEPIEEKWARIGQTLYVRKFAPSREALTMALWKGEEMLQYVISSTASGIKPREKYSLPPGRTLTYSFVLNYPSEPFHGACANMGYVERLIEPNRLTGTLPSGRYELRARLFLHSRYSPIATKVSDEFMKERNVKKLDAEQIAACYERIEKRLAEEEKAGRPVEYSASVELKIAPSNENDEKLRKILDAAMFAFEDRWAPNHAVAIAKFQELAEKGKGTGWEPWALYGLGRTYLLKKEAREALRSFERVVPLAAGNPYLSGSVLVQQKACYELLGETEKAKEVDKVLREKLGSVGVFAEGVIGLKPSPESPK